MFFRVNINLKCLSCFPFLLISECASTLYGPFCNTSCSEYCQNKTCNQSSGHCITCIGARSGPFCEIEIIPDGKVFGKR